MVITLLHTVNDLPKCSCTYLNALVRADVHFCSIHLCSVIRLLMLHFDACLHSLLIRDLNCIK